MGGGESQGVFGESQREGGGGGYTMGRVRVKDRGKGWT